MSPGCPHIDFTSDFMRDHLYEETARIRAESPVVWSEAHGGYWVLTRYADVHRVLQDPETFTSTQGVTVPYLEAPMKAVPFEADPPEHRDYRKSMNPYLTPEAARRMEDDTRRIVDGLIDTFIDRGRCDLAREFAEHVSTTILFRNLLGADESEMEACHEAVMKYAYEPTSSGGIEGALYLMQFCYQLAQAHKGQPGDMIVDSIVRCEVQGRPADDLEMVGMLAILIFGGVETTANATTAAIKVLSDRPELQRELREHPERIARALDEFLRFDPPLVGLARRATRDVEIDGHLIKKGDAVYYSIAAANRDPAEFPNPDEFDPWRNPNRHLAFSAGIHRCAGSNLARMMLKVSLEQLLARLDDITIDGEIEYIQAASRSLRTCPIRFRARDRATA